MSLLKPGTLCVIVAGCSENIGLIVEVLEHLGPYPPRDDAYHIRTVSGRHFPQLKTEPNERLARGCSSEAITDRHKLRPLVEAKNESGMQIGVSNAVPALCDDNSWNHESFQSNGEKTITNELVAPFSPHPAEPLCNSKADYPHLVIRFMSAVYQREPIEIRQGVPGVHIGHHSTYVQHPSPLTPQGQVSEECRLLLLQGVSEAVKRLKHRMCVVWKSGICSYVEADGTITESGEPPSGGVTPPASITFDQRVPFNQEGKTLFMTNNKGQNSDLLRELLAVPLSERIERVANDVLLHQDKFRTLAAHDLAEALGVPQPECPSGDWSFTRYAERQTVEEYAERYSSSSEFAEIVYALEDSVSPTRFNDLLKEASRFDDVGPPKFDFLTREERELLEEKIVFDALEANASNGMNCLAHYDVEAASGDRLPFEAFVEDDGACIDLKTPYDFRDKKFVCLDNCLTESW